MLGIVDAASVPMTTRNTYVTGGCCPDQPGQPVRSAVQAPSVEIDRPMVRIALRAALFLLAATLTPAIAPADVAPGGEWVLTGSPVGFGPLLRLPDGRVLLIAANVEQYDPTTGAWTPSGSLLGSGFGTATLLPSGLVLIAGGGQATNAAELYNPATGVSQSTGSMQFGRSGHQATLLFSGKVLVSGGRNAGNQLVAPTEIYDPQNGTWSLSGVLNSPRTGKRPVNPTPCVAGPCMRRGVEAAMVPTDYGGVAGGADCQWRGSNSARRRLEWVGMRSSTSRR